MISLDVYKRQPYVRPSAAGEAGRPRSGPVQRRKRQYEIADFEVSIRNRPLEAFLRSKFNKQIANWKAESLRNSISKESAPEDASIASYSDFESDHFVVGRLRRRTTSSSAPPAQNFTNSTEFQRILEIL